MPGRAVGISLCRPRRCTVGCDGRSCCSRTWGLHTSVLGLPGLPGAPNTALGLDAEGSCRYVKVHRSLGWM